jgi:tetratricopeptide (TPR) repeat protein
MGGAAGGPSAPVTRTAALAALLLAVTAACFLPVLDAGFVNFDDDTVVLANEPKLGFSARQLAWMAGHVGHGHWQPLTWFSFAVDRALWGMDPRGFHLTNLVLHGAAVVLAFALGRALLAAVRPPADAAGQAAVDAGAAIGALLFAIHPLRVESVAWVTERRDVLAGVFYLAAVLAHVRGAARGGRGGRATPWLVAAWMWLSLLGKAWAVTLPAVLLILDAFWLGPARGGGEEPRPSARRRRVLQQVLLLWIPAAAVLGVAAWAQHSGGVARSWETHTLWHRLLQAGYGLCFYPIESLLPLRLSPLYPLGPSLDPAEARFGLALAAALSVTAVVLLLRRRRPAWAATWLTYAVVVAPVLGLFQSGPQLVADRYSYLACLPFALLAGAGLRAVVERHTELRPRLARASAWGAAILVTCVYGPLTHAQAARWTDDVTLWQQAARVVPGSYFVRYNLGLALGAAGRGREALPHFEVALRHLPRDRVGRAAIRRAAAVANAEAGRTAYAESLWQSVLAEEPGHVATLVDLGILAERLGRPREAEAWWRRALAACESTDAGSPPDAERADACTRVRALLEAAGGGAGAAPR